MAIWFTDKSRSFGQRVSPADYRQECVAEAIVAMTTTMLDNADDEVGLFWLPRGAVVTGITASASDMDTNGTPALVFDIGDDADEDRLMAATTIGQAGTLSSVLAVTGHLYKYTADTRIKAYVKTAAATAAAGTLYVSVRYFVDLEYSTTGVTASTTA